ncbi:MAG: hypothetical protein U0X91_20840 [Spirosomataceae bacterium]
MNELKKVAAQVKDLLARHNYKGVNPEITVSLTTVELNGEPMLTYKILIQGTKYHYGYGDSFKTALQRLELDLVMPDNISSL